MRSSIRLALFLSLLVLGAAPSIAQAQDTDPICSGLTGAAFGQCTAAIAVGCDGTASQPAGCSRIADNFTRLTGTSPPWELGSCSCYTYDGIVDDVRAHVAAGALLMWCATDSSFVIEEDSGPCGSLRRTRPHFSVALTKDRPEILGVCSNHGLDTKIVTPGEPEACFATIKKAAADTGLKTY